MTKDQFEIFPETQRETAREALAAAFGSAPVGAIMPVFGGVSGAAVFRVEVGGRHYVLRIEGLPSPLRNPQQYVAMRIAADAGIAPQLRYVDEQSRVAVMDFIAARPLKTYPGGPYALALALGALLARVQATQPFPRFVTYPDIVARLWAHVCGTGLFAPGVLDAHTDRLAQIRGAYVWDSADSVSSHNDILPRNVLFDGKRLWLIDWESAYRNDPLVDLATMLDNFAPSPELEVILVQAWLGHALDRQMRERLALVRALTRLYYAGVLFSASAAGKRSAEDTDLAAPTHVEFERAIREGRLKPDTFETSHVLGKMYLDAFFSGNRPPGLPPPLSQFLIESTISSPSVMK